MTQHPLEFDPNSKGQEPEFDTLSDTWSRADALLEELPKARRRKETKSVTPEAPSLDGEGDQTADEAETAGSVGDAELASASSTVEASRTGLLPRQRR